MILIGDRLTAYRIDAGYKTRVQFERGLKGICMAISYARLSKLEKSESTPTQYEIDAVRALIGLSADCWVSGICNTASEKLERELSYLNDRQILLIIKMAIGNAKVIKKVSM